MLMVGGRVGEFLSCFILSLIIRTIARDFLRVILPLCAFNLPVHDSSGKIKRGATNLVLHFFFIVLITCLLFTISTGLRNYSAGVSIMAPASTMRILTPPMFLHCWSMLGKEEPSAL